MDTRRTVHRATVGGFESAMDELAHEAPLELRVDGEPVYVTMRTPGSDVELIEGLLIGEGVLQLGESGLVSAVTEENVATLSMDSQRFHEAWPTRSLYANSACGVCGATAVDALASELEPIGGSPLVASEVIAKLPDSLRSMQPMFERTGGVHAAGLATSTGEIVCVREDVGRHNAVDKVVGWASAQGLLPATDFLLVVSGRVSFEIAQKAARARIPIIAAVSAPTTLAIDIAERLRMTICGFVRDGRFNVYSHRSRLKS